MAALRADDALHLEPLGGIDDAADQLAGEVGGADLDAAVGGFVGILGQRPRRAGLVEDAADGAEVLRIVEDFPGGHQDQVVRILEVDRHLEAELGLHVLDLRLHRHPFHAGRAAALDGARGGHHQALRRMARRRHALAHLAHHVGDVVADRADHRAAAAQRAAVVDQRAPLGEFRVRDRLRQAGQPGQLAEQGVLLLPGAAQRLQLVDGRVLRIARFGVEQAGLGAQPAMHAAGEEAGDGGVQHFLEGVHAAFVSCAHDATPFLPKMSPLYQRETNTLTVWNSLVKGSATSSSSTERTCSASISV